MHQWSENGNDIWQAAAFTPRTDSYRKIFLFFCILSLSINVDSLSYSYLLFPGQPRLHDPHGEVTLNMSQDLSSGSAGSVKPGQNFLLFTTITRLKNIYNLYTNSCLSECLKPTSLGGDAKKERSVSNPSLPSAALTNHTVQPLIGSLNPILTAFFY